MSQQATQLIELALVASAFLLVIVRLARRRLISFRYAVGWILIGLVALAAGLVIPVIGPIARWLRVGEVTVVAATAVALLLSVCVQLSISISGLQRQLQRLAEELAILRHRVERAEDDRAT